MGPKAWKNCTIAISLIIVLLPLHLAQACEEDAWEGDESTWVSFFMPDISGAETLMPFYYSDADWFFYRTDSLWPNESRHNNSLEWQRHLQGDISAIAIDSFLYSADAVGIVNTLDSLQAKSWMPCDYMAYNGMVSYARTHSDTALVNYLAYSKTVEHYLLHGDPWAPRWENNDTAANYPRLKESLQKGLQLYQNEKDAFLKARYAYQCIKIYGHFPTNSIKDARSCIALYDETFGREDNRSVLKYWALYFKAISERHIGDTAMSTYLLSRVFDSTDEKEESVYFIYNSGFLLDAMQLAHNNHEKASLLVLDAMHFPGRSLNELEEIERLDPENNKLGMLLAKEVNKLEQSILMPKIRDMGYQYLPEYDRNRRKDCAYLKKLKAFVTSVAAKKSSADPGLWDLVSGYLSFMEGHYKEAAQCYKETSKEKYGEKVGLQLRLSKLLLYIAQTKSITPEFEQKVYSTIAWMKKYPSIFTYGYYKNMLLYLSTKYEEKGDVAKTALIYFKTSTFIGSSTFSDGYFYLDQVAGIKDYDEIITLIQKKRKTPFESYLTSEQLNSINDNEYPGYGYSNLNLSQILDYKGTWYMRHNMLRKAYAVFKKIPDTLWGQEPYKTYLCCNPFYVDVWNTHIKHKADSMKYNKISFLERVFRLQDSIAHKRGNMAKNYFMLGNAYYSMTYYGNFWMMNMHRWSDYEVGYYNRYGEWMHDEIKTVGRLCVDNYYGCKKALHYYLMAGQYAKDSKFVSLCAIMANKCDNNLNDVRLKHSDFYNGDKTVALVNYFGHPSFNPRFNTQTYNNLLRCDQYIDYISWIY